MLFLPSVGRSLLELVVLFSFVNEGVDQDHNCRDNLDEPGKNVKDLVEVHIHLSPFLMISTEFWAVKG